jgi:hypothetical protein
MLPRVFSWRFEDSRGRGASACRSACRAIGAQFAVSRAWAGDAAAPAGFSADAAAAAALLLAALMGLVWWRVRASRDAREERRQRATRRSTARHGDARPATQAQPGAKVSGLPGRRTTEFATPASARAAPAQALVEGIDLIQQAEFLSLLGERDAAVALLSAHLDGPGAAESPVWLKLMHVHRRFGDRHSFEQLRPAYQRRFGIEAPLWACEPASTGTSSRAPRAEPAFEEPDPSQTVPAVLVIDATAPRDRRSGEHPPAERLKD